MNTLHQGTQTLVLAGIVACGHAALAQNWNQNDKLLADDGATRDRLGEAIAISGGLVVIGSPADDDSGDASGSAYVFDASTGSQISKLLAGDGASSDFFGSAVAIDDGLAVVGAWQSDALGMNSGAAYLYDAATGNELFQLLADNGFDFDHFGTSVAIDGNIVVVGAPGVFVSVLGQGAAYLFDTDTGAQLNQLSADDPEVGDDFGQSVAIADGIVAVGNPEDSDKGLSSGAVYLFDASTGDQIAKIVPDDGQAFDRFGTEVALADGVLAVGLPEADGVEANAGAAYLYDVDTQTLIARLEASDGESSDKFGHSIDVEGGLVVVGARLEDENGLDAGAVYLYDAASGTELEKLLADEADAAGDAFGTSVGISAGVIAIGAPTDDDNGSNAGAAFLFSQGTSECLTLTVDNLVAGEQAIFTITNGTPGAKAVTVYGLQAGQTVVNDVSGYCATFGIQGVKKNRVLGGLNRAFDGTGEISFNLNIPDNRQGLSVLFQSAQQGTCPDECVSNLIDTTIQ